MVPHQLRLLWLVAASATVAYAEPARVELVVADTAYPATIATLLATPAVSTSAEAADAAIEVAFLEVEVPGTAALDLRRDVTWRLEVHAQGLWAPDVLLAAGTEASKAVFQLVPTATLTARIESPADVPPPASIAVRLRSPEDGTSGQSLGGEIFKCPIKEHRWRCEVPSGTFDLRLRAPGFVSHYVWGRSLPPLQNLDLGAIVLLPGASVVGWLVTDDGSSLAEKTRVLAAPREAQLGGPRARHRHRSLMLTAPVNEDGFFHFEGLPPGSYMLRAEQEGFVPLRSLPVMVSESSETELREPLVLTRPAELRVILDPPADPWGEPWNLKLLVPGETDIEHGGRSGPAEAWKAPGLEPRNYLLMVADSQSSRVADELIEVEGPVTEHWIRLEHIEIEGLITLGGEPLAAELAFGGSSGVTSVKMQADEEGRFFGYLPRAGKWPLDVRSDSPRVFRRLRAFEVEPAPGTSSARVEIELPGTRLEGDVVDAEGHSIERATVLAVPVPRKTGDPSERPSHTRTRQGGLFAFEGLAPAAYRLQAIVADPSGEKKQSEPVEVELREDDPFSLVRLVIGRTVELRGRVVAGNAGIPGAAVLVRPVGTESGGIFIPSAQTSAAGRFVVRLPANTRNAEITVFAPGFVLYRSIVTVADGEELPIFLEQSGGSLAIRPRKSIDLSSGGSQLYVVRADGIQFDVGTLSRWTILNRGSPFGASAEIPMMSAGGYTVCWPSRSTSATLGEDRTCVDGYLSPHGKLEIVEDPAGPESEPGESAGLPTTNP